MSAGQESARELVDDLDDAERYCWECGGEGFGALGEDFSNDDPVNEPDGQIIRCPNCGGSGNARDCTYW